MEKSKIRAVAQSYGRASPKAMPAARGVRQNSKLGLPRTSRLVGTVRGQSLYEVVFALAIVSLVMIAIVALATTSVRNASFARNKTLASRYTQELSEWLREERDTNFATFKNNVDSDPSLTYCFDTSPPTLVSWSNGGTCSATEFIGSTIFIREVDFECFRKNLTPPPLLEARACSANDVDTVDAKVVVYWDDAQGRHEVRAVTTFADWRAQ